jgi:hypothetical protein
MNQRILKRQGLIILVLEEEFRFNPYNLAFLLSFGLLLPA